MPLKYYLQSCFYHVDESQHHTFYGPLIYFKHVATLLVNCLWTHGSSAQAVLWSVTQMKCAGCAHFIHAGSSFTVPTDWLVLNFWENIELKILFCNVVGLGEPTDKSRGLFSFSHFIHLGQKENTDMHVIIFLCVHLPSSQIKPDSVGNTALVYSSSMPVSC